METRAHNVLIGAFVLAFVAAMLVFIVWLAKTRGDGDKALYDIVFTDSVTGLGVGGDVRFNGIKVGAITRIAIEHENPSRVRVTVEMGDDVPVRQDSTASMQLQGITGVTFVQISGGTQASPRIPPTPDYPYPEIRSRPSQIAELVDQLPKLLERSTQLVDRGNASSTTRTARTSRPLCPISARSPSRWPDAPTLSPRRSTSSRRPAPA